VYEHTYYEKPPKYKRSTKHGQKLLVPVSIFAKTDQEDSTYLELDKEGRQVQMEYPL